MAVRPEDDGHAWALPSSVPVGSPISRSEIGRHTRGVGILECGDLVLGQCDVERGDGIGEMAGPGGADPGADTTGVLRTHASATWAVETPRSRLPDMPMSGRKRRTCLRAHPERVCAGALTVRLLRDQSCAAQGPVIPFYRCYFYAAALADLQDKRVGGHEADRPGLDEG